MSKALPPMNMARDTSQSLSPDMDLTPESLADVEARCQAVIGLGYSRLIEALLLRGRVHQAQGNFQLAVKDWEAVLRIDELNQIALKLLNRNESRLTTPPQAVIPTAPITPPAPRQSITESENRPSNVSRRIRVYRSGNLAEVGYLNGGGKYGPPDKAQSFWIPVIPGEKFELRLAEAGETASLFCSPKGSFDVGNPPNPGARVFWQLDGARLVPVDQVQGLVVRKALTLSKKVDIDLLDKSNKDYGYLVVADHS